MTLILCLFLMFEPEATLTREVSYKGNAYDLDSGELIYIEEHVETYEGDRILSSRVAYRGPSGELLAEKAIDYRDRYWAPNFVLLDHRFNLREGGHWQKDELILMANSESEKVRIPDNAPVVLDAGFDQFIKSHWNDLLAGERVSFYFGSPSEQGLFKFFIQSEGHAPSDKGMVINLEMRLKNPLLRFLLPPINVSYIQVSGSESIRLLEFQGITNLNKTKTEKYRARIVFPQL